MDFNAGRKQSANNYSHGKKLLKMKYIVIDVNWE
jgi:hypothetical protein